MLVLKNKKKIRLNGNYFFILNDTHLILYLALHLFHHNFKGWNRYDFLDKVIRKINQKRKSEKYQQIWNNILTLSNKYRLNNFICPAFLILKKLYKSPIPDSFLTKLKQKSNLKPVNNLFKNKLQIFEEESRVRAGTNRFKLLFFLSPNPTWKKLTTFFYPQVVFTIGWLLAKITIIKFKRLFFRLFSSSQNRK